MSASVTSRITLVITRPDGGGRGLLGEAGVNQSPTSGQLFDFYHQTLWTLNLAPHQPVSLLPFSKPSSYPVWPSWCQLVNTPVWLARCTMGARSECQRKSARVYILKGPVVGSPPRPPRLKVECFQKKNTSVQSDTVSHAWLTSSLVHVELHSSSNLHHLYLIGIIASVQN